MSVSPTWCVANSLISLSARWDAQGQTVAGRCLVAPGAVSASAPRDAGSTKELKERWHPIGNGNDNNNGGRPMIIMKIQRSPEGIIL